MAPPDLINLLLDPFTWLGAATGLVVGIAVVLCVRWLGPRRFGIRASVVSVIAALALGVAGSQMYEAHLLAKISAEIAKSSPPEMVTVTATEFEFRSTKYLSKSELLDALRLSSPKPARIGVSWFASAYDPAERQAAIANAELARAAVKEAGLPVSRGAIGVESLGALGSSQPSLPR
jgi:hypothetical protein